MDPGLEDGPAESLRAQRAFDRTEDLVVGERKSGDVRSVEINDIDRRQAGSCGASDIVIVNSKAGLYVHHSRSRLADAAPGLWNGAYLIPIAISISEAPP
jgi:hypothetical protein